MSILLERGVCVFAGTNSSHENVTESSLVSILATWCINDSPNLSILQFVPLLATRNSAIRLVVRHPPGGAVHQFIALLFWGKTVYIACSSLCFGKKPFGQALRSINDLHFQKVDLAIHESGSHLKPSEVHADLNRIATRLRASAMSFAAFHLAIEAESDEKWREIFRSVCRLARMLAVPVINIQAAAAGSDVDAEVRRLRMLVRVAEAEGVILTIETALECLTADPKIALELCQKVAGLGLTLDPSPYHSGPNVTENFDELYAYVRHVRLRDTSKEKYQVMIGQGEVEYGRIINQLNRTRYDRALSVDVRDGVEGDFPTEPEVRKLKYLLESMV